MEPELSIAVMAAAGTVAAAGWAVSAFARTPLAGKEAS
jgi:hypothetical protein